MRVEATFEITGWDQETWDESPSGTLGRARVTKQFSGDIDGTSVAEVLMATTGAGPAAYAAQERFTGTFAGRRGSFVAQHGATSLAEGSRWVIVTGSGSGDLDGLSGTGTLDIVDGVHRIAFDYELEAAT